MVRINGGGLLAVVALCGVAAIAHAQNAPTPAQPPPEDDLERIDAQSAAGILRRTYDATKDATTTDDFHRVVEVCERAIAAGPPERILRYAHELAAWGYNRRGEIYADQAARLFNDGQERQANELDALALDDFESALRHDPKKWKAIHNRGVSLALHGKMDEALADFSRVLELMPEFGNSRFNRAEILAERGEFAAAVTDYSEVLKRDPNDQGARLGRANCYLRLQQPAEAEADFHYVLQLSPMSAAAAAGRGEAKFVTGRWNEAGEDYRLAIRLDPKYGRAYRNVAWLMATCPEERFRNGELALEAARKAIEIDGKRDWTYLDALAAAEASCGDYAAALATVAEAIGVAPPRALAALERRRAQYDANRPFVQGGPTASVPPANSTR
ncbi:MAG: tetratricopeptide repeat protein [Pirellulaceae bacterium]|jgi:tetratricopeptide (TPR) repeat protein|nr:tetratricopeptide repeat protein [Pirellulaceae bacterium]